MATIDWSQIGFIYDMEDQPKTLSNNFTWNRNPGAYRPIFQSLCYNCKKMYRDVCNEKLRCNPVSQPFGHMNHRWKPETDEELLEWHYRNGY